MQHPTPDTRKKLMIGGVVLAMLLLVNPIWKIDLLLIALYSLILGHIYLREKLLLVLLGLRPVLDIWRDSTILVYHQTAINFNAGLSVLMLVWGCCILLPRLKKIWRVPGILLFTFLIALMIVSASYSIAPLTSLIETMKFTVIAMLFILSFLFLSEKKITRNELLITIVLSAIIPILFGLSQLFFGTGISTFGIRGRIYGTFAHPNVFAFFLLTLLIIHIEYGYIRMHTWWQTRINERHILTGLLILLLLMTFTRGAWVGGAVFLIALGTLHYRKILLWILALCAGCYVLFFPLDILVRTYTDSSLQNIQLVQRLTARNEDSDSIGWRLSLIEETIPIIAMRPLYGYGYGTFELVWGDNRNLIHLWDDSNEAHNDYLRFGLELGIVGLACYSLLLLLLFFRASVIYAREQNKDRTISLHLLAFILAFIAMSFADNMLHHTPVMWLIAVWWGAMFGVLAQEKHADGWNFLK